MSENNSNLHHAISSILLLAQCFGMMPVTGITSPDVSDIKFKWFSFRILYAIFNLCGILTMMILTILQFLTNGLHIAHIFQSAYHVNLFIGSILFFKVANNWHDFMKNWYSVELSMKRYEYQPNLTRRFKITTLILLLLASIEHSYYMYRVAKNSEYCPLYESQPLKTYFGMYFNELFTKTSFSYWKAILIQVFSFQVSFGWNFIDLFIMVMCTAMAESFRKINKRVANTKVYNEPFWKEIRQDYLRLTLLCKSLDTNINGLVTLCLINNLVFITAQLFMTLRPIQGVVDTMFFVCSFGYYFGRTVAMCLHVSWINYESKLMLPALYNMPVEYFGAEANRLIRQIAWGTIAVSGSNFFQITRSFCMKILGLIITFEILLQQIGPLMFSMDQLEDAKPYCIE